MWFPKFPYTNFSQINLDWVLRQIKELSEWMNRYFKDIRQDLDDEINNRIEGDKALGERIDQEIQDRTEADTALGQRIDQEIQDRTEADTALGQRIDKEIQDRTNADTALGQRIDTETAERKAADQQLQSNIDAEEAAREAADQQLQNGIGTLRSDAILKNGSTTTTAVIPFAQGIKTGSITEATPDTGVSIEAQLDLNSHKITALADGTENTDAVNVGQMNTADDQAVSEANSYTDSQLEAFAANVHSIPAGGSSGQVLAKVDGTNYNVTWVDQQGGGGVPLEIVAQNENAIIYKRDYPLGTFFDLYFKQTLTATAGLAFTLINNISDDIKPPFYLLNIPGLTSYSETKTLIPALDLGSSGRIILTAFSPVSTPGSTVSVPQGYVVSWFKQK